MRAKRALLAVVAVIIVATGVWVVFMPVSDFSGMSLLHDSSSAAAGKYAIHAVLQAVDTPQAPLTAASLRQAEDVIAARLTALGISGPKVQMQGGGQIVIDLVGTKDPGEVMGTLTAPAADLEFKDQNGRTILTASDVKSAQAKTQPNGQTDVELTLTPTGAQQFATATRQAVSTVPHQHIGIYIDVKLLENPQVMEAIDNGHVAFGGLASSQKADRIVALLTSGPLPVKLIVQEQSVTVPTFMTTDSMGGIVKACIVTVIAALLLVVLYVGKRSWSGSNP